MCSIPRSEEDWRRRRSNDLRCGPKKDWEEEEEEEEEREKANDENNPPASGVHRSKRKRRRRDFSFFHVREKTCSYARGCVCV